MPLEEVIAGFTFTGFATVPPTIAGLQSLGIFGTTKDGKNTQRAPGGPAFTNVGAGPTYGTAWGTVNTGTSTAQGIDTGLVETAAFAPGGWTMVAVARAQGGGNTNISTLIGTSTVAMILQNSNSVVSNHPALWLNGSGTSATADFTLDLGASNFTTNWRMYALSFSGVAASGYILKGVTDGVSKTTVATFTHAGNAANHFCIGYQAGTSINSAFTGAADIAMHGIYSGVLTDPQLASLRTWLQGVLGVRGVTGF